MDSISTHLGAAILMIVPMLIVTAAVLLYRWRSRSRSGRNPLTKALLNPPGASLRAKLTEEQNDFSALLLIAAVLGAYIGGFAAGHEVGQGAGKTFWAVAGLTSLIVLSWLIYRAIRSFKRIQRLRLGLDGEMATGEELSHLMRLGYHVFHDIPGANYNVDHAVVGPNGVFAVETKTHAKPASGHEAYFDGRVIHYPDRRDFQAVEQANRNADSLRRFLSRAIGQKVRVGAIVILPGWCVKHTGKSQGSTYLLPARSTGSRKSRAKGWAPRTLRLLHISSSVCAVARHRWSCQNRTSASTNQNWRSDSSEMPSRT